MYLKNQIFTIEGTTAPVYNPILHLIGLQIPCMEKERSCCWCPPTISEIKILIQYTISLKADIYSATVNTRDKLYFASVWFNKFNIQGFLLTMASSFEVTPSCIVIYKSLKVGVISTFYAVPRSSASNEGFFNNAARFKLGPLQICPFSRFTN